MVSSQRFLEVVIHVPGRSPLTNIEGKSLHLQRDKNSSEEKFRNRAKGMEEDYLLTLNQAFQRWQQTIETVLEW